MNPKLSLDDIEKLKSMLKYHPEGSDVASVLSDLMDLQDLANNLKFPINSFSELVKQLESKQITTTKIGGLEKEILHMKGMIPAYYFPIASIENFYDKVSELMKGQGKQINIGGEIPNIGEEVSPEMAPLLSKEIKEFLKAPKEIPAKGYIGLTRDEVDRKVKEEGGRG